MQAHKILIIEDEAKIARFVQLELRHEGYMADICHDGKSGLEAALKNDYSLIVLDIMLPLINGIEVLKALREKSAVPVILLTARDQVMDKINGLNSGADDYMTKPFAIEELIARIKVAIKRTEPQVKNVEVGGLKINAENLSVTYNGEIVPLTKMEYDLLYYLAKNCGAVVTREKLLREVWGYDFIGNTNIVDVYVRYLRGKLDEKYGVKFITTVRGAGYIINS